MIEQTRDLLERRLSDRPDDGFAIMQLSWLNLALNRKPTIFVSLTRRLTYTRSRKIFVTGAAFLNALAEIEAHANQPGEAVPTLQRLLSIPAGTAVSIAQLKTDPVWDPIRDDLAFQQLLAGKELVRPNN